VRGGLARFSAAFGRFERIVIGDRQVLMLLIKNPAGANEAIRTLVEGAPPRVAVIALNDAIADGRDVSWIWDVDFEPLLPGLDRSATACARRSSPSGHLRGLERDRSKSCRGLTSRSTAARADAFRRRVHDSPTYTAMPRCAGRRLARARDELLGAGGMKIRVGHLYPDYLNICAHGNIAALAARARLRGHELTQALGIGRRFRPTASTLHIGGARPRAAAVAHDLVGKSNPLHEAVEDGAVFRGLAATSRSVAAMSRAPSCPGRAVAALHDRR
jgi:hypothetical protein